MILTALLLAALGLAAVLGIGAFGLASLREGERRAARVAFGLAVAGALPFFLSLLLPLPGRLVVLGLAAAVAAALVVLFLLPIGRVARGDDVPRERIDERDIMFARACLEPGTPNYEAYYNLRPENRAGDDRMRALPGLLSSQASEANLPVFAATESTFDMIAELHDAVDGPVAPERVEGDPEIVIAYIQGLARYWGAHAVGITELKPYHVYSHLGRGKGPYGAPIPLEHRFAIAFTVEMDRAMMRTAPAAPTLLESARQYANAAQIAVQLANYIRSQGFPARAHIDGNYRVVAPLVARDAGLGEIGRLGLLMTPDLGPRVRLGVVTTDLPLVPDQREAETPVHPSSVLDFCRICKKCADSCPVRAIPFGDREFIGGTLRWRIDQEICYRYWCAVGTDCGRCVVVCPYSYPDSPMHNLVRQAVRRSGFARRAVLWLDGLFYGAAQAPGPAPAWITSKPATARRNRGGWGAGETNPDQTRSE